MTTKQGLLYKKSIIENMEDKSNPIKDIEKKVNTTPYLDVLNKNRENANKGLESCKLLCDEKYSDYERDACYLGCDIKYGASSASVEDLSETRNLSNPYDKWKKAYNVEVNKSSNRKVKSSYKVWDPYHSFGWIWNGWRKRWYYYWSVYWARRCYWYWWWRWRRWCGWGIKWRRRKTYYWKPTWRWGVTKRGKKRTIPAVWERCNWKETHRYGKEKIGQFVEDIEVTNCYDIMKDKNIPDDNPDNYRDYSIHNMDKACQYGMEKYQRKNCVVGTDKKTITCNGTKTYGSVAEDQRNYSNEQASQNEYIDSQQTETFDNIEGFSNACKSKCAGYTSSNLNQKMKNANDECYVCELKNNPFIRYDKPREQYIDTIKYISTKSNPLNPEIKKIVKRFKNHKSQLYDLDSNKQKFNKTTKQYEVSSKRTGKLPELEIENNKLNTIFNNMPYSKKKNLTINAYLEDMKSRNPSKNIEYGVWMGLMLAAGITTATLIKD